MIKLTLLATALVLLAPSAYAVQDNSAAVSGSNNSVNQVTGNGNVLGTGAFSSSSSTTNTNTANGGSATATGGQGGRGGDGGTGIGVGVGGDARSTQTATTGNQSISISNKRNPVSGAASSLLVAADDTCMGSSSAGAQGIGFGVSLGSTWTDADCVRRKDARELHNMGYKPAALALLCQSPQVARAMATAGTPCASEPDVASSGETVERSAYPTNGSRNR